MASALRPDEQPSPTPLPLAAPRASLALPRLSLGLTPIRTSSRDGSSRSPSAPQAPAAPAAAPAGAAAVAVGAGAGAGAAHPPPQLSALASLASAAVLAEMDSDHVGNYDEPPSAEDTFFSSPFFDASMVDDAVASEDDEAGDGGESDGGTPLHARRWLAEEMLREAGNLGGGPRGEAAAQAARSPFGRALGDVEGDDAEEQGGTEGDDLLARLQARAARAAAQAEEPGRAAGAGVEWRADGEANPQQQQPRGSIDSPIVLLDSSEDEEQERGPVRTGAAAAALAGGRAAPAAAPGQQWQLRGGLRLEAAGRFVPGLRRPRPANGV